jgi:polyphosphate kinase 2 (PPK2 family)
MLEQIDLGKKLSKKEYKSRIEGQQHRLLRLQRACWEGDLGSIFVFEGWDAAGKGTAIRKLTQRLEPRGFSLQLTRAPRTHETHLPWMWRFWVKLPNHGEMAIFDRSWYGRVLVERVEGFTPESEWRKAYRHIVSFERALADDRYAILKFFLHIDKKEQKRRLSALEADSSTRWQVDSEDWEHHERYDQYLLAVEEMLERTETEWGPWTIVEATDRRWARVKMFDTVIRGLEESLTRHGMPVPGSEETGGGHEARDELSSD